MSHIEKILRGTASRCSAGDGMLPDDGPSLRVSRSTKPGFRDSVWPRRTGGACRAVAMCARLEILDCRQHDQAPKGQRSNINRDHHQVFNRRSGKHGILAICQWSANSPSLPRRRAGCMPWVSLSPIKGSPTWRQRQGFWLPTRNNRFCSSRTPGPHASTGSTCRARPASAFRAPAGHPAWRLVWRD